MKPAAETALAPPVQVTEHRGHDDLLTAGLGIEGLRSPLPPAFASPDAPTVAELRRRAIWTNWRGIADLRPGGGAGHSLPPVPGREFASWMTVPGARHPHRVLLQVPDNFDLATPCVVVAPASGSRGVYGAIAVAAPWALPRGCAVAYTDKAAGTDYVDLVSGQGVALDGRLADAGQAVGFDPAPLAHRTGVAFKHAHSQDNPEADWGVHVHQAAEFALRMLGEAFPAHAPFTAAGTRVIAVGVSNGGGAVLRAAEIGDSLIDAVVAGEPNVFADAPGARPLYDVATLAARLMPCALLDLEDLPQPPAPEALRAMGELRCASLAERGELQGGNLAAQARDARLRLHDAGFDDYALHAGAVSSGFDLWRAVAAAYASAYGRFATGEHPCGFSWGLLDEAGQPRAASRAERAAWWADGSGIPPGNGIALLDPRAAGSDPTLPGIDCLRALWEGPGAAADRVRDGVNATRAGLPRAGLPVLVVHGRDDGLVPVAMTSRPWVEMARAADREVAFWVIPGAQHFDAFLALPDHGRRYQPLLPHVHAALDAAWARLDGSAATLPAQSPLLQ